MILLGGVLLNILLNWIFIFGHWGASALGLDGAGLATLLARVATAIVMLGYVVRAPALKRWLPASWMAPLSWPAIGAQIGLGSPVAARGIWLGLAAGLATAAIILIARFRRLTDHLTFTRETNVAPRSSEVRATG